VPERLTLFATTPRGTEALLARELETLGAKKVRQQPGGVRFAANLNEALHVCLWTRLAMRVLYPLGEADARGQEGLYEAAYAVPWEEHLTAKSTFAVDSILKSEEHTHSGFLSLKIKDAIVDRLREKLGKRPDVDTRSPDVKVVAHLKGQQLSLWLDLCGESLFRRGYRIATTPAPLKETLAAAVLAAADYTGEEPLADPMCGSGTLVIEAGLIASKRPPSLERSFAIERWPFQGEKAREILSDLKAEARKSVRAPPFPLVARDRDEDALAAAKRNVTAAHLKAAVTLELSDALTAPPPDCPPGLVVTNPPYGDRLKAGGQKGMKTFYFKLGESLARWEGWRFAVLSGNEAFESAFHRKPRQQRELWNGPIQCELLTYDAR
jgi:23S rRNA (guanine2445-N2)-methyltransferase / 23S rRNA (guanine2069-N7)-methyltransferase